MSRQVPPPQTPLSEKEHSIALKVMRLAKPTFYSNHADAVSSLDTPISGPDGRVSTPRMDQVGLTDMLTLPSSFGNIYLGENFAAYLSIHRDPDQQVKNIGMKAELQTASQRFALYDNTTTPLPSLDAGRTFDVVIQHEIKELGVHILVCSATYLREDGERKYFRKFFKFQVTNPLAVRTKTHVLSDSVFLEAQIQNVAVTPLFLSDITFHPQQWYSLIDLNASPRPGPPDSEKLEDDSHVDAAAVSGVIRPQDVWQYLYELKLAPGTLPKMSRTIGKIEIRWKTGMGEVGRVQTSQLVRKPLTQDEDKVKVSVVKDTIPSTIHLYRPCTIVCSVQSLCDVALFLKLDVAKEKMGAISVTGVTGKSIGVLNPGHSLEFPIEIIPLAPGLQKVSGLRIVDEQTESKAATEVIDLIDILVEELDEDVVDL